MSLGELHTVGGGSPTELYVAGREAAKPELSKSLETKAPDRKI